jgi:ribosomal protein L5
MSLYLDFKKTIAKKLQSDLGLKNVNEVPKLTKVIVCCGIGSLATRK